jgi:hypothetical protein
VQINTTLRGRYTVVTAHPMQFPVRAARDGATVMGHARALKYYERTSKSNQSTGIGVPGWDVHLMRGQCSGAS